MLLISFPLTRLIFNVIYATHVAKYYPKIRRIYAFLDTENVKKTYCNL